MLKLFQRDEPAIGSILYRGTMTLRLEEFFFLEKHKITIAPGKPGDGNTAWSLKLSHPEWGEADLVCLNDPPMPPDFLIDYAQGLSPAEREDAKAAGTAVMIRCKPKRKQVLSDRKKMLRYMRAIMADDAVGAVDHASEVFWSRSGLDEELAHDADLDIQSLFTVHAVGDDSGEKVRWVHTHGLDKLGAFDFDILNPGEEILSHDADVLRAIAFLIASGEVKEDEARASIGSPKGDVRFVPAKDFQKKAIEKYTRMRDPEDHTEKRVVLCEPGKSLLGDKPQPSRFLSGSLQQCVMHFGHDATELMAQRARASAPVLQRLMAEFEEFQVQPVVKIGYETDHGPDKEGNRGAEHMWFELHGIRGHTLDATLLNEPFDIARMKAGDRGEHPIERLTDWQIMTPVGNMTPRTQMAARFLREHADEIREAIRNAGDGE